MNVDLEEFNIALQGDQANSIFMEPVFRDTDILSSFRVMGNVVGSRKMLFAGALERILRSHTGCGFKPIGGLNVTERKITANRMKADLKICWDEFMDTIMEETFKRGVNMADLSGTLIMDILFARIKTAIKKDIARLFFFGNEASLDPAFDLMDGFLTVYLPQMVAAGDTPYLNSGSGSALNAGDATDILKGVYANQANELRAMDDNMKKIYVDTSVYDGYRDDLESGSTEGAREDVINGRKVFTYRGIEIMPQLEWKSILANDLGSTDAHIAILTVPQNLVVATNVLDPENQIKAWYDDEDEDIKIKTRFNLGGNYVHPSLVSAAY